MPGSTFFRLRGTSQAQFDFVLVTQGFDSVLPIDLPGIVRRHAPEMDRLNG